MTFPCKIHYIFIILYFLPKSNFRFSDVADVQLLYFHQIYSNTDDRFSSHIFKCCQMLMTELALNIYDDCPSRRTFILMLLYLTENKYDQDIQQGNLLISVTWETCQFLSIFTLLKALRF